MSHFLQLSIFVLLCFGINFSSLSKTKIFYDTDYAWVSLKSGVKLRSNQTWKSTILTIIPFKEKVRILADGDTSRKELDGYNNPISWTQVQWQKQVGWVPIYTLNIAPFIRPLHPSKYKAVREFKTDTRRAMKMAKEDLRIVINNSIEWADGNIERIELAGSFDDYYINYPIVNTMKIFDQCKKRWLKMVISFFMSRYDKETFHCTMYDVAKKRVVADCRESDHDFYQQLDAIRKKASYYLHPDKNCMHNSKLRIIDSRKSGYELN